MRTPVYGVSVNLEGEAIELERANPIRPRTLPEGSRSSGSWSLTCGHPELLEV